MGAGYDPCADEGWCDHGVGEPHKRLPDAVIAQERADDVLTERAGVAASEHYQKRIADMEAIPQSTQAWWDAAAAYRILTTALRAETRERVR